MNTMTSLHSFRAKIMEMRKCKLTTDVSSQSEISQFLASQSMDGMTNGTEMAFRSCLCVFLQLVDGRDSS